jgi:hypothetical protein
MLVLRRKEHGWKMALSLLQHAVDMSARDARFRCDSYGSATNETNWAENQIRLTCNSWKSLSGCWARHIVTCKHVLHCLRTWWRRKVALVLLWGCRQYTTLWGLPLPLDPHACSLPDHTYRRTAIFCLWCSPVKPNAPLLNRNVEILDFLTLLNPSDVNRKISQMFDDRFENAAEGRLGLLRR